MAAVTIVSLKATNKRTLPTAKLSTDIVFPLFICDVKIKIFYATRKQKLLIERFTNTKNTSVKKTTL